MGSAIALTAALATPDWVAGLVLVGAGATLPVNPRLLEGTADPDRFGETVEAILRWSFGRRASPRLVEQARRRMLDAGPAVLHRDFLACSVFDVRARLRQLRLPAEVMYGSEDRMTPPSANEELARGIEGARTLPIDGAGHMVMLEKPKEIQAAIREFLQLAAARWTDAARAREAPKDMTV
jgi:pimeloyl-ACP methyl ester carboxylesterase